MDRNLETKLYQKYPDIFRDINEPPNKSLMHFGLEIENGWYDLIDALCESLEDIATTLGVQVVAAQVKEKFGGLRFYYYLEGDGDFATIDNIVQRAENASYSICELCGKPGKLRGRYYKKTLCQKHHKERNFHVA